MNRLISLFLFFILCFYPVLSHAGWVEMTPEQTVGANSIVEGAAGTGYVKLNKEETELTFNITVTGLSGPIMFAHFHGPADPGATASPVRTIEFTGNHAEGVWKNTDSEPLTPALVNELKAGRIYVNVHTSENPAGEIRGQVHTEDVFYALLDQDQSVTVNQSVPDAKGTAILILNDSRTELSYFATVSGLSNEVSAAHIHGGAPIGGTASPLKTLPFIGNHTEGIWTRNDDEPFTTERLNQLLSGLLYVNIHTSNNPAGEIRGQILGPSTSNSSNWDLYQ